MARWGLGLAICTGGVSPGLAAAPQRCEAPASARGSADAILGALIAQTGVPGFAAAYARGESIVWTGVAGHRRLVPPAPVTPRTTFRLASVSKLITAVAVAHAAAHGRLSLDAPLGVIARRAGPNAVGAELMPPSWSEITPRQLAAHVAGVPHYQTIDAGRGGIAYRRATDVLEVVFGRALLSSPGTRYAYSSYGYTLLSAALEWSTGRPFDEYVAAHVVKDLAIRPETPRRPSTSPDPNAATAYERVTDGVKLAPPHDYSYSLAGAGFVATAPALARFGGRVATGRIVDERTFARMLRPIALADGSTAGASGYEVGLGWRTELAPDGDLIAHHSGVALGARSTLVVRPATGEAVALLSNAAWTASMPRTAETLRAAVRSERAGGPFCCPIGRRPYAGTFQGGAVSGRISFEYRKGKCRAQMSVLGPLKAWLDRFEPRAAELTLVALDQRPGGQRWAVVTSVGAFVAHLDPTERRLRVTIGRRAGLDVVLGVNDG